MKKSDMPFYANAGMLPDQASETARQHVPQLPLGNNDYEAKGLALGRKAGPSSKGTGMRALGKTR